MESEEKTSIQVSKETKERLAKLGTKDDTYNDIVKRLLDRPDIPYRLSSS